MSRPTPLTRALRLFGDIRESEVVDVLLLTFNLALLLVAYYIAKTVREPLILAEGGARIATYAAAAQAVALTGFLPLYSWFSSRVDRARLVVGVGLFFALNLELFAAAIHFGLPFVGVVFFIWVGIFSLAVIAQFWSYANDVYTKQDGERLFPIIAIGATLGSPFGTKIAKWLFVGGVSIDNMLHLSAAILVVQILIHRVVERRLAGRQRAQDTVSAAPLVRQNGFRLVFGSRYLALIALLLITANLVNTTGEYVLRDRVASAADAAVAAEPGLDRKAFIGTFYADFFFAVNVLAVVLQALVASRLVRRFGVAGVVLALPIVALGAYGLVAAGVGLGLLRWAKVAENATDYSLMNTAKATLWLPASREEKYVGKQTVDTFFVRAGDVLAAAVVFVGTTYFAFAARSFAIVNIVLIALWLVIAATLLRVHARRSAAGAGSALPDA